MTPEMAAPLGVYVHFPYCTHRCPYCDFAVTTERPPTAGRYARAVLQELSLRAPGFEALALRSIYLGGGTPSLWDPEEIAQVIGAVRCRFAAERADAPPEITVEVNPESSDRARLRAWRAAGVNRVSIGVQSFDPGVLAKLGRRHRPEAAEQAIREAAEELGNASVDLIYAARRSSPALAAADAARAVQAGAVHVSAYALTVDAEVLAEEVPFARLARQGRLPLPGEDESVAQARAVRTALRRAGLRRYEISNYARPGRASVHNRLYWDGESYLGLGAGAYGCRRGLAGTIRYGNRRDASGWLAEVEAGRLPDAELDELDARAERNERVMLALRTTAGAPLSSLTATQAAQAEGLVRRRLAVRLGERLVLTSRGMELHSAIAERLFE